jgi:glycogen operon protein
LRRRGEDATLLLVLNGHHDLVEFTLPAAEGGEHWSLQIDTNLMRVVKDDARFEAGSVYAVTGRSALLFTLTSA